MKIEIRNGEKVVKENSRNIYYELKYDWPMDTSFNINNYSPESRLKFPILKPNMEVWTSGEKTHSFFGTEKESIEECEEVLWQLYQNYKDCENHEFVRESPSGVHYSNGAGFCKKCGMFKSHAFSPETLCSCCHKPTTHQNLKGEYLCIECQKKQGVLSYGYSRFITEEYLKLHFQIDKFELNSYSLYIQSDNLEVWYYLIPTVDKGIYKLYLRDTRGVTTIVKQIAFQTGHFGLIPHAYFVSADAKYLLYKRYRIAGRISKVDNLQHIL